MRHLPNSLALSACQFALGSAHPKCPQRGSYPWPLRFFASSISIEWTPHRQTAGIQNMRVNHGGFSIFVPEEFLDRPDIIALLQQMRREAMP